MNPTPIRPWTPDRVVIDYNTGTRLRHEAPKRACNRCGLLLGDLTDSELLAATLRRPLIDSDRGCPRCLGVHALAARPEPREPDWHPDDGDEVSYRVYCPDRENPARTCFVYDRCGCVLPQLPHGFDPLTTEGQQFLDQPCPHSPTGVHWWASEIAEVVCPVAESCYHADHCDDHDGLAADTVGWTPGVYPLAVRFDDGGNPVWEAVTLAEAVARRDASPAVPTG